MPSKKILTVFILCLAAVVSFWLFTRIPTDTSSEKNNGKALTQVETTSKTNIISDNNWKSTFESVTKNNTIVTDLTVNKTGESTFDESSLTAKFSQDFFSQYLLAKQGGANLTQDETGQIVNNVLANESYSQTRGAVYTVSNLHISDTKDKTAINAYKSTLATTIKRGFTNVKEEPLLIMAEGAKTKDAKSLAKLDPIILSGKMVMTNMLNMTVPREAVGIHIRLLNSLSNTLADLESMRVIFDDPIRGLGGMNSYSNDANTFIGALNTMSQYLVKP